MSAAVDDGSETPNQRAARLRREKRQNKATAEERLAKIKQLNGGIAPPEEVLGGADRQPMPAGDPDEVDISTQNYGPRAEDFGDGPADNPMFQAMLQMQREQQSTNRTSTGPTGQDDEMTKMLQQMMGMAGGDPNDPNSIHNTQDPMQMLSSLMNNAKAGSSQASMGATQPSTRSAYLWRLIHAIFAMVIAGYIAATSTFNGSLLARTASTFTEGSEDGLGSRLFLIFITAELGLQSARYFLEGGQLQGSGMLATISNFAPPPYGQYVRNIGRWASILGSIVSDAMVVVFVLGAMAWWNMPSSIS